MLKNFLKRYPNGGLVSELVRVIDHRFIVRCLLQVNGVTMVSALGTGDTVEMAEDQARMRLWTLVEDLFSSQTPMVSPKLETATSRKSVDVPSPPVTVERDPIGLPAFPEPPSEVRDLTSDAWLTTPFEHSSEMESLPLENFPLTSSPQVQELLPVEATAKPTDNSDIIARTDIHMKRLGWSVKQGRDFVQERYGKSSRHSLSPEELLDFLQYLESNI